jgi:hypothetical protein
MAYNTKELKKAALIAVKKYNLIFVQEIVALMNCSSATFYNHGLHEDDEIMGEITKNRVVEKVGLRTKWRESDNPTAQSMLYKLCANEDELRRLSVTKNEVSGENGKPIEVKNTVNLDNLSLDELRELERIAKLAGDSDKDSTSGL